MKLYIFFMTIPNGNSYLMNQPKPICANCKFFIKNTNECSKFGYVDIITGEKNYEDAISIRKDKHKCGENAISFEKNHFRWITDTYYFIVEHQLLLIILFFYGIPTGWILFFYR